MRILKRVLLFAAEVAVLIAGFVISFTLAIFFDSRENPLAEIGFFFGGLLLTAAGFVLFRRRTRNWKIEQDAATWMASRSWRQLHPRRARLKRMLYRCMLWLPSSSAAFVLFFLPVASHLFYLGQSIIPHYRVSVPLNWLVIESQGSGWLFFSEEGASRYGLTPIWFNRRMPSGVVFLISDPEHGDGWYRPEKELASGHTTHESVRDFRLGMLTSSCYEYRHIYGNAPESSSGLLTPPVLWESLCATRPNGVNYNLRTAFLGHREDLPAFYKVLNSATTNPD